MGMHETQRACYIAIRRKGWMVHVGVTSVWAHHHRRDVRIYGHDFRELLNKVTAQEREWNNAHPQRDG